MTNPSPYRMQSPAADHLSKGTTFALRHAAGGDILDRIAELERRIERLEAQVKTH